MFGDVYDQTRRVKSYINDALSQLDSFVSILNQNFNVNGETLNKAAIDKAKKQINTALNYVNYTVLPTAFISDKL
ncbi:MAG: hypothetical protein IKT40_06360 [Bacilli bacterium]|nr:hypothetical protein [Bacilli bacterium]